MVGWHHRLNGHEFEQVLGVGDGQGSLGRLVRTREMKKEEELLLFGMTLARVC